jgi:molecular chaperone GrpE (heat shock protein)
LPVLKILALLTPLQKLLTAWGVEPIGEIQAHVDYDPQQHKLVQGTAQPGDRVEVVRPGYRQGETLLHRAEVQRLAAT